jgi:hypothetical protein
MATVFRILAETFPILRAGAPLAGNQRCCLNLLGVIVAAR